VPGRRAIIGSPEKVRAGVEELAVAYGAEEVIAVTITHDHQARRHSYELLAEAMGLEPRELAAASA
jgi:alkanesulfonate monooxygenase SsuD/methylene tetrahydromethanopterin reductase-like flavin-dependent oxidoreductase (luciferase family)